MSRMHLLLTLFLFVLVFRTSAQDITIRGRVTDAASGQPLPGVTVLLKHTNTGTSTDAHGLYAIAVPDNQAVLVFSFIGYSTQEIRVKEKTTVDVKLNADGKQLSEVVVSGFQIRGIAGVLGGRAKGIAVQPHTPYAPARGYSPGVSDTTFNTESYDRIEENIFLDPRKNPLSTFSIDVDAAAYSNVRRFLRDGMLPPKDAVRLEELVNYFHYDYPQPTGSDPVSITAELAPCPWNPGNRLLHLGLQAKAIPTEDLPPANLVFLIDVSGSMMSPDKLPLVKEGFRLLVNQLRPQDRVAVVVYAGAAGLVLPPTPGNQKKQIMRAIDQLEAGGSTAGGAGIQLAYRTAAEHFQPEGNNRVILATDGDFNVGASSDAEMERLIEAKRKTGVFLTVLGFGTGNLKDAKMEKLADRGNGNYAYVDNLLEAKKVFVTEFGGTLFTLAKDVKLQLEFNPARVKGYRLIGYENRALRNEDFNNDQKDAGDLGAGHAVTALYEIIPAKGSGAALDPVDELKYQTNQVNRQARHTQDLLTLKLRYKDPKAQESKLLQQVIPDKESPASQTSDNFRFAAAVAQFGLLLRESAYQGQASYASVLELAQSARGRDPEGYREEFIRLVRSAQRLQKGSAQAKQD